MSEGAILNIEFLIDHLHQISEGLIHIISRTSWPPKSKLSDSRWLPKQGAISPIMKGQFHFPCRPPANLRISFSREIYQAMHPLFAVLANKTLGTSISELFKNFTKEVFISFSSRMVGACLIFLIGTQGIYFGMQLNRSNHPRSLVWQFVESIHEGIVYGAMLAVACAFVAFVVMPFWRFEMSDSKPSESANEKSLSPTPEELQKQRQRECERTQAEENRKKQIEEQRLIEEQRKQEAIKRRRERSAKDVASDALDDFL